MAESSSATSARSRSIRRAPSFVRCSTAAAIAAAAGGMRGPTILASMMDQLKAFTEGRINSYYDVIQPLAVALLSLPPAQPACRCAYQAASADPFPASSGISPLVRNRKGGRMSDRSACDPARIFSASPRRGRADRAGPSGARAAEERRGVHEEDQGVHARSAHHDRTRRSPAGFEHRADAAEALRAHHRRAGASSTRART